MSAQRGDFGRPPVDRTGDDDATFRARLERIEAAPAADIAADVREEIVAQVLYDEDTDGSTEWADEWPAAKNRYRGLARAAIDALKPAPGTDSSGQA